MTKEPRSVSLTADMSHAPNKGRMLSVEPIFAIAGPAGALALGTGSGLTLTIDGVTQAVWSALKNQACCNPTTAARIVMLHEQDVARAIQSLVAAPNGSDQPPARG